MSNSVHIITGLLLTKADWGHIGLAMEAKFQGPYSPKKNHAT
jgi:hypothetical protein